MKRCAHRLWFAAGIVGALAAGAFADYVPGNLVVSQYGDGSAALGSSGTAIFLRQYTVGGVQVGSDLALPTTASGSNHRLVGNGSATSEGFLTLSANGRYLLIGGYDSALGGNTSTGTPAPARTIGRIGSDFVIDTTTAVTDPTGNIRSVASDDGSNLWFANSSNGLRYTTLGSTGTTTQITASPTNVRVVNTFNNQLYLSASSGAFQGVSAVGSGLPTTSGQTTAQLAGFPTATGPSAYDYFFADSSTLFVADDRTVASGGGIQKWVLSGGTWSLAYTIGTGTGSTVGARGLTGVVSGGVTTLYATTTESSANRLISVVDGGSLALSTVTNVATAGANTAFRGVEFTPVPSPGSLALLGLGGVVAFRRRR
jgi:MYXO-CTERM domain-containing protein